MPTGEEKGGGDGRVFRFLHFRSHFYTVINKAYAGVSLSLVHKSRAFGISPCPPPPRSSFFPGYVDMGPLPLSGGIDCLVERRSRIEVSTGFETQTLLLCRIREEEL